MAQLTLQIPEHLAQQLENLAAAQDKSVEQVALEHLRSLNATPGSPPAILRTIKQLPYPHPSIIDELEAAMHGQSNLNFSCLKLPNRIIY